MATARDLNLSFGLVCEFSEESQWLGLAKEAGISYEDRALSHIRTSMKKLREGMQDWFLGIPFALFDNERRILATAALKKSDSDTQSSLSVWHVAVRKDLRGKGLGKLMLQNLFAEAERLEAKFITTFTSSDNTGFYEACGMTEYGRLKNILRNGCDRVFLYKILGSK